MGKEIIIGSRGSKLALLYAQMAKDKIIENTELKDIKYVRSHAQAIDQCQKLIIKHKFKTIISADTAGSAKELSLSNDRSIAAIASKLSAKIYKLKILKQN